MEEIPSPDIACSLNDEEFRRRRALARETLLPHLIGTERLTGGLALTFPDTAALRSRVETFVGLERQCCGFLTFTVSQSAERLVLTIEGPPDAQSTLDMLAALITDR